MNAKRISACLLLIALLMAQAGCGHTAKPEITLIVKCPTLTMNTVGKLQFEDSKSFLELAAERFISTYDDADVTIKVEVFDYIDENEAILGSYGTNDATDMLYEGYFNMAAYVSSGKVVPLDDLISDELRADISSATWAQSSKNGKTYMMPFLSMQNIMMYNKSLLRECGLDDYISDKVEIQNWSLEEWEMILDTLAAKLPDDSYPMMMYANNNQGDTHIMSFIRSHGGRIFDDEGAFDFENPETITGLRWIQDGIARGWYPPNPALIEINDCQQLFTAGRLGFFIFNIANYMVYDDVESNYGFVNFPGNIATSFITGFEIFDNGDENKIKAAKDFLRFIYEDEDCLSASAGNLPESRKTAAKYADKIPMLSQFSANADNVIDFMNSNPNWQGKDDSVRSVFWPHIHELLLGNVTPEDCAAALDRDCNAAINVEVSYHP